MKRKSLTASTITVALACCSLLLAEPSTSASAAIFHAPRIKLTSSTSSTSSPYGWSSSNWSGYALSGTAGQYNSISGAWTVPTVAPSKGSSYSSSWIGIDGYNNSDLIQTGTEQDYYSGAAHYDAWWEILPAAETVITNMTVKPGDQMTANIVNDGNGDWTITLDDKTQGETFTTTQAYSGPAESAEWIQEAPTIGGRVATLANYGTTTFDPGTVNGGNPGLVVADGGVMIQKRAQVSTPSLPDTDTDGFAVAYGATAPTAPAS
ncbi:MAG: G1 family endopeptidase [Firmicutes bacterium]|nr:G1 family endopeptidase [Bacillota bacterium]